MDNKQRKPLAQRDKKNPFSAKSPKKPAEKPRAYRKNTAGKTKTHAEPVSSAGERVQKVLSRGGLGSRREIERWIDEGRLKINGVLVVHGAHLKAGDYLQLNERVVHWEKFTRQPTRVLIYHKPTGEIVTRHDPQGRPTVFSQMPKLEAARWISVGPFSSM